MRTKIASSGAYGYCWRGQGSPRLRHGNPSHSARAPKLGYAAQQMNQLEMNQLAARGGSRQSSTGRAYELCVMLANASIQGTTTLQRLAALRRTRGKSPGGREIVAALAERGSHRAPHSPVSTKRNPRGQRPRLQLRPEFCACYFAPHSAPSLSRPFVVSPWLDPRFRGDDTCWLRASRCSSCFAASPQQPIAAA